MGLVLFTFFKIKFIFARTRHHTDAFVRSCFFTSGAAVVVVASLLLSAVRCFLFLFWQSGALIVFAR